MVTLSLHTPADTVSALFRAALGRGPEKPFLAMEQGTLSYAQAADWSRTVASGLTALGVERGDRVAILSANRPEMVVLWLACLRLGACFCPLNSGFTGGQLANLLRRLTPAVLVADPGSAATVADGLTRSEIAIPTVALGSPPAGWRGFHELERHHDDPGWTEARRGDLAAILCTSGTTGPSKAVALSHRWFTKMCETTERHWNFAQGDVFYSPFPLYHIDALALTVGPAIYHATTAAIAVRFSVRRFWDDIRRFQATVFDFMGSTLTLLWKREPAPDDRDHPARLGWGVPMPDFAPAFEDRFGCRLVECYGSTDTGLPVCGPVGRPPPPGACGRVVEGYELAILSPEGLRLPAGQSGEIALRGDEPHTMMEGYVGDPDATLRTWRGLWHHTGDRGRLDESGYLYFEGRLTDSIRRRGENVSAQELEELVLSHPDVVEAAAIGVPSELTEEEIKVAAIPRRGAGLDAPALARWLAEQLPRYMTVRYVELVEDLPRTDTQKVMKTALRGQWRTGGTWDAEQARYLADASAEQETP
ncbi:MAG TPA: AMP-binding protein [Methylomirabilota bacterium]|nr:AMP-binding protein [Methylomirabilota bacterium]